MAARFKTRAHTLSGSAETLESIFDSPADTFVSFVSFRAPHANSGNVTWEDTDGESGGFIQPGEAAEINLDGKFVKTSDILFNGTSGDVLNVTVIG